MKYFKIRLFIFIGLTLLSLSNADTQNIMWIDSVDSGPNKEIQFTIKIANIQPFVAFQGDISLPNTLSYISNSALLSSRADGHQLAVSLVNPQTLRVIVFSFTSNVFLGNSGSVLTFSCLSGTQSGTYELLIVNPIIGDSTQSNILTEVRPGRFILQAPDIVLNVDSLSFGSIPLDQYLDQTIIITNQGNLPLSVTALNSTQSEIRFLDSSQVIIDPGSSINRIVRFQPLVKGNKSGILTIRNDDPNDTLKVVKISAHAYAVNEIHLGSILARSGYTSKLYVRINNMEPFTAFQFTLALPSVMKFITGSELLTSRKVDHIIYADTLSGNRLRVITFSPTNSAFSDNDGEIVELSFRVDGVGGIYSIPISEPLIGDLTGTNVISASYGNTLEIASPSIQLSGNTVDFGTVSIFDTALATLQLSNIGTDTLVISSITSGDTVFWVESESPLSLPPSASTQIQLRFHNNKKGSYDKKLIILHNDIDSNPSSVDLTAATFIPNKFYVISTTGSQYSVMPLSFGITNYEEFIGFQFDVSLPSQIIFQQGTVQLSERSQGHSVSASVLPNGDVRVVAFSYSLTPFLGDSGEVVQFDVNLNTDSGTFPIEVKNVIIANTANQNVASEYDNGMITVVSPPVSPSLNSPSNYTIQTPTVITFNWNSAAGSDIYNLQIATDLFFSNIVIDDSAIVLTSREIGPLENLTQYFWRVNAANIAGTSNWSEVWNFTTNFFADGDGSVDNPYEIETSEQLNYVRYFLSSHFILINDISLDVSPYNTGEGWVPIGSDPDYFTGNFDGNYRKISGLTINRQGVNGQGLFGWISGATIRNIGVVGANITGGDRYTGALLGFGNYAGSTVSTGSTVSNCYSSGTVRGNSEVGGLVGLMQGLIENSFSSATVTGEWELIGGLVGIGEGNTINCYATGNVTIPNINQLYIQYVGGLAGLARNVTNCYSTGNVTISKSGSFCIGGLIGELWGAANYSFGSGVVTAPEATNSGNFVGYVYPNEPYLGTITGGGAITTEQMQTLSTFTDAGWEFYGINGGNIWNIGNGRNDGYPYLQWQYPNDDPLPIQLASFIGSFTSANNVHLEWETLSEINNCGFYVESRAEGEEQFSVVSDLIPGAGYTLEPQYYDWTDSSAYGNEIQYRLKQVDCDGLIHYHGPITVTMNPTSIKDQNILPIEFKLEQNYPNPFNPSTIINYQLPINSNVTIKLYDVMGKEVAILVDGYKEAGYHSVRFDANFVKGGASTGIYFYRLVVSSFEVNRKDNFVDTKKLILIR